MPTSILRIFGIVRDYKARFVISQIGMLIAAVCIVAYASLISKLVDEGMVAGDQQAAVDVGIWMLVLAVAMGLSIAIAGSQAVFFSQGVAFYVRRELYNKVQGYSFENFDHRPTSDLMVRLNSDVVNIQNAVLYAILLGSLAPFLASDHCDGLHQYAEPGMGGHRGDRRGVGGDGRARAGDRPRLPPTSACPR